MRSLAAAGLSLLAAFGGGLAALADEAELPGGLAGPHRTCGSDPAAVTAPAGTPERAAGRSQLQGLLA